MLLSSSSEITSKHLNSFIPIVIFYLSPISRNYREVASYDINGNDADPFPRFVKVFFFQEKSHKAYKAYFL